MGAAVLNREASYDKITLLSVTTLISLGVVMVTSASLSYAEGLGVPAWYFAIRHVAYLSAGLVLCILATYTPLSLLQAFSQPLLIFIFGLLAVILIPGITREVNGSVRWLFLGPISIQASECAKLILIIYWASFLTRRATEVKTQMSGFLKPILILSLVSLLLLLEPDFGAVVVIVSTTLGLLFLAGVPARRFLVLVVLAIIALVGLSVASPYRIQRLTAFLNPWLDQFNSGYQLTQSLIAFGRGGWFGTGLGNSVQKLLYLPEPHTDFIYAVLAEELGVLGALGVLGLFVLLVWRVFKLGREAVMLGNRFAGFLAFGIGLWFGLQAMINIGVNIGALPTKGLTLPFMSYGGNSLLVGLLAVGILLRIEYELSLKGKSKIFPLQNHPAILSVNSAHEAEFLPGVSKLPPREIEEVWFEPDSELDFHPRSHTRRDPRDVEFLEVL